MVETNELAIGLGSCITQRNDGWNLTLVLFVWCYIVTNIHRAEDEQWNTRNLKRSIAYKIDTTLHFGFMFTRQRCWAITQGRDTDTDEWRLERPGNVVVGCVCLLVFRVRTIWRFNLGPSADSQSISTEYIRCCGHLTHKRNSTIAAIHIYGSLAAPTLGGCWQTLNLLALLRVYLASAARRRSAQFYGAHKTCSELLMSFVLLWMVWMVITLKYILYIYLSIHTMNTSLNIYFNDLF